MKNRMSFYTLFFLFLFISTSFAGNKFIGWYSGEWDSWYQGSGATAVIQTQDGGFAVTGNTNSCENSPYCTMGYVTRLSSDGTVLWSTVIGDADTASTYMTHLTETADGGIAAVGYTAAGGIGSVDMVVVKYGSTGQIVWQRVYGQASLAPYAHRIYDNNDDTLTVLAKIVKPGCGECGCSPSNITQVTINSQTGALVGEIGLSGGSLGSDYKGYQVSTGFIALPVTFYNSTGKYTVTVQKFNGSGLLEWSKAYYAKDSQGNRIQFSDYSLAELSDGYLVNAKGYYGLLYQFKINPLGVVQWMKSIKVYEGKSHWPNEITVTADGYGLISLRNGYTSVENIIIKTNSVDGSVFWAKKYGNSAELFDFISPTASGFAAVGSARRLQLGVFDTNGLVGETCDSFTISDVSASVTTCEYFEEAGAGSGYCAYPNLISASADLVFATNTFANKEMCTGTIDIPAKALLVSPLGTTNNSAPTYTWNTASGATWYKLWVGDAGENKLYSAWHKAADICSGTTCSVTLGSQDLSKLQNGSHSWYIQSWNLGGDIWSNGAGFTVQVDDATPSKVALTSPANQTTDSTPAFTWNKDPESTWYKLWVGQVGGDKMYATWHEASVVCSNNVCSVTPDSVLPNNNYEWYVRSWNENGAIWSSDANFTVQVDVALPLAVTLGSPSGQTSDSTPVFTWNKDPESTWYQLWVEDAGGNKVDSSWHEASAACSGNVCSVTPASALTDNDYTWYVKSYNEQGEIWSTGKSFQLGLGADGAEIAKTVQETLALFSVQEELVPITDEVSAVLADVLSGDPNVPVTFDPSIETLQTILTTVMATEDFSKLPATITMVLNYGNGYTASDGSKMTGNMTVRISNLSVSMTSGVTANLNIDANNIKKDGVLVLNGDINVAVEVEVDILSQAFSADVDISVSNLTTNMGKTAGAIKISMPYLSLNTDTLDPSSLAFSPITITFTNFVAAEYTINSGFVEISSGATIDTIFVEADLKTNEGNVKGKVEIGTSDTGQTLVSSIDTVQVGDYVLDLNQVVFDPEDCDYPTGGNVNLTHGGENYTITFTEECKTYTLE